MHPVLIELGSFTLYTYGLFVGLGFVAALFFASKNALNYDLRPDCDKRADHNRKDKNTARGETDNPGVISDLFFVLLVSAILGARLFYVGLDFPYFWKNPLEIVKIWNGGLVFYGGFISALVTGFFYIRKKHLNVWVTADIVAPAIALGHAVGRIGCFFAGCCYGKACSLPWAVTFTDPDSLAPLNIGLHPTQLYSVASNLAIFFILLFLQKQKKFHGMVFWSYVLLYGLFRSIVEMFRGDPRGSFLFSWISFSQGIGMIMVVSALFMLLLLYTKKKNARD